MSGYPFWPEAFPHQVGAEETFDEHTRFHGKDDDELITVAKDFTSTYTNIEGYERRTLGGSGPMIWFFGGSTMFGFGQRDDETIASDVVRIAAADGQPVRARNFGFPAYLAWQEAGLLGRLLGTEPRPDLIVFYHGVNDYASVCRQIARGEVPVHHDDFAHSVAPKHPVQDCQDNPVATGAIVDRIVADAMRLADQVADGLPIVEFWQPYAATRPPGPDSDALMARMGLDEDSRQRNLAGYVASLSGERSVVDLTDAIGADVEGPIYFDWAHSNERGAQLVAEAMWERSLRDQVDALS